MLRDIAEECGLDTGELEHRLDRREYSEKIHHQSEEAKAMGITGIPTCIIGSYLVVGAQPYRVFKQAVELAGKQITHLL